MRTKYFFLFFFLVACAHKSKAPDIVYPEPKIYALQKMESAKLSPSFTKYVTKKYKELDRDDIVKVNLQGFLRKADYSGHYSKYALKKCQAFLREHKRVFSAAEKEYGVDRRALVALLWVETKFGDLMGSHSILSVFFSLLQGDHPTVLKSVIPEISKLVPGEKNLEDRIKAKAISKSQWALGELSALEKIYEAQGEKMNLMGSYAGAFGYPQFVPSSYLQWAQAYKKGRVPNLNSFPDAITSVANYLHSNGWKEGDEAAKKAALFHYNHSEGYGNVILKIASELQ